MGEGVKKERRETKNKRGRTLSPGVGEADSRMVEVLIVKKIYTSATELNFQIEMYVWAYYSWKQRLQVLLAFC